MLSRFIKKITPPFIMDLVKSTIMRRYGWFGDYASWEEAASKSTGYDSFVIVEKVKKALLKVKKGEACYERDSVLFYKPDYVWPVLAFLMKSAAESGNKLFVTDFGGSLGSLYFQHKNFFRNIQQVRWHVVEQPIFVEYGKKYFEDEYLKFFDTLENSESSSKGHIMILSSVLQYLKSPYELLGEILQRRYPYVIIDRTPYLYNTDLDRLTVQIVPPKIYQASYPAYFFSESKMLKFIQERGYKIIAEFGCVDKANIPSVFKGIALSLNH